MLNKHFELSTSQKNILLNDSVNNLYLKNRENFQISIVSGEQKINIFGLFSIDTKINPKTSKYETTLTMFDKDYIRTVYMNEHINAISSNGKFYKIKIYMTSNYNLCCRKKSKIIISVTS